MLFMNNIDPDSKVQRPLLAHNQWFGYRPLKSLTPNHRINLLRVRDQLSLHQLFPESHTLQVKQIIRHNHQDNILSKAVLNHTILKLRVIHQLVPKKFAQIVSTWIWLKIVVNRIIKINNKIEFYWRLIWQLKSVE